MAERRWVWETFDPNRTGLSGDIKVFRNEEIKSPGILNHDAPPAAATVMAREVIQNSWDAAMEEAKTQGNPRLRLQFRYLEAIGDQKTALESVLALGDLAERLNNSGERAKLGVSDSLCLDTLADRDVPLRYMVIEEAGTTGMYGAWNTSESLMYFALCSLGYTPKPDGGGSYGYGKAGLIHGSATRSVITYSCFRGVKEDHNVTRRLLGMTYWGEHAANGERFTGFARFGSRQENGIAPFVDDEADEIAESLQIPVRCATSGKEYGSTFLLLDPTVKPDDLVKAIERYWWPALEDSEIDFDISVIDNGDEYHPRPKRNPNLRAFIDAYEVARLKQEGTHSYKRQFQLAKFGDFKSLGTLGVVAEPDSWSYPQRHEVDLPADVEHRSLVALMRNPRMVVEYYVAGQTPPFVRGAFIADESVDGVLRRTEPAAHDSWQTKPNDYLKSSDANVAETVLNRIKSNVATFRNQIKPPKRRQEQMSLPDWDKLMRRLLGGEIINPPPPPPGPRDVTIGLDIEPVDAGDGQIQLNGVAKFDLHPDYGADQAEVQIHLNYALLEDGFAADKVDLTIETPPTFSQIDSNGCSVGKINRGKPACFEIVSEPHNALWSGRIIAVANVIATPAS